MQLHKKFINEILEENDDELQYIIALDSYIKYLENALEYLSSKYIEQGYLVPGERCCEPGNMPGSEAVHDFYFLAHMLFDLEVDTIDPWYKWKTTHP